MADGIQRSIVRVTLTVGRTYGAPRSRVFEALIDSVAKVKWFVGGDGYISLVREMSAIPGGHETVKGRWDGGAMSSLETLYHDVIPSERVVYLYVVHLDNRKISASLVTPELREPEDDSGDIHLVVTEQGIFPDGYDDPGLRERGTQFLLDVLGNPLKD